MRPFIYLSQPHHVTASHPSPGDNHQSTGGPTKRTQGEAKWPRETHTVTYAPGLSTLSYLSRIVGPPSHHQSSPNSVYLVPVLNLLPPSTTFWPYCTHAGLQHRITISGEIIFEGLTIRNALVYYAILNFMCITHII